MTKIRLNQCVINWLSNMDACIQLCYLVHFSFILLLDDAMGANQTNNWYSNNQYATMRHQYVYNVDNVEL